MIRTLTARTTELDDVESAVSEILEQLDLKKNLLRSSAGILTCYVDALETGLARALCDRLPFDVAGIDTMASATSRGGGQMLLSLSVLTSDEASFSVGISGSLLDEYEKPLTEFYERTSSMLPDRPSLMISFAPLPGTVSPDFMVRHLDAVSGGVPMFGPSPSDFGTFFRKPLVIFNGEGRRDSFAAVLVSGNINPKFTLSSIPGNKIMKRRAIVTASKANVLKEVNGIPVLEYMKSLGLERNGQIAGVQTIPLVVDFNDGTPPGVYAIYAQTPEGHVVLGGAVPVNSTIGIGTLDDKDVMETIARFEDAVTEEDHDFLMVISCAVRNFALGWDNMAEIDHFRSRLGEAPFLFTYAGGEICPVQGADGGLLNRFHNTALAGCTF